MSAGGVVAEAGEHAVAVGAIGTKNASVGGGTFGGNEVRAGRGVCTYEEQE